MGRGRSKKISRSEKILLVLLDGHETPVAELEALLKDELVWERFSAYLWDLLMLGAEIKRNKVGRKIVSYQLVNTETMTAYARERGLIAPLPIVLTAEDLMVAAG